MNGIDDDIDKVHGDSEYVSLFNLFSNFLSKCFALTQAFTNAYVRSITDLTKDNERVAKSLKIGDNMFGKTAMGGKRVTKKLIRNSAMTAMEDFATNWKGGK